MLPDLSASPSATRPLLALRRIEKSYGPVNVLKGVDLTLIPGEVHALLGENGAGKSTLMKIVFGLVQPTSGSISLLRTGEVRIESPRHALSLGIGLVSQELSLVPQLDVAQNIFLGVTGALQTVPRASLRAKANEILAELAPHIDSRVMVGTLGMADRQLVEIARTLARGGEIIAFDEPTSSLTPSERDNLFRVIRKLRSAGKAVIYISHRMKEIREICDRMTVLRDGNVIISDEITKHTDEHINAFITGRQLASVLRNRTSGDGKTFGDIALDLQGLTTDRITDVSLQVRSGEILGLAGLVGSGRSAVLRAIFGVDAIRNGTIAANGQTLRIERPVDAINAGIAYIPEDRRGHAVIPMMSIEGNFGLANYRRFSRYGFIDFRRRKAAIRRYASELSIKPADISVPLSNLSGGNQQKVVIARWLGTKARIFLFDEPTRGIDVGAKADIYALLRELAKQGAAVIVVSSELPEIMLLSDNIGVMANGQLAAHFAQDDTVTEDRLMRLMSGETTR